MNMRRSKQIIVMRTDLNMRKGKMVAQGAHASTKVLLEMLFNGSEDEALKNWISGKYTKICCQIDSESGLKVLYNLALEAGLPCSLILDAGLTEFQEPTYTCVAIGPAWSEDIDKVTGSLKLL